VSWSSWRSFWWKLTGARLHTLSAGELYTAHVTPYLEQATEELNSRLQATQGDNAQMTDRIKDQRAEIERLLNGLEWVVKDIEGSVDAMRTSEQGGFDELRSDVWQMEQEMAATR